MARAAAGGTWAPLHVVVLCEARDVLCELRGNRRFAYLPSLSFVSTTPTEHPLVDDVKRLRDVVRTARDHPLPADAVARALDPLLRIVQSRDTSGNITGVALLSLDRVVAAALALPPDSLHQYAGVLSSLVSAVASCRFDATDPGKDEVVLSRITKVLSRVITSPAASSLLSDASLLQGFESCLDIAVGRRRTSELLKRSAEATVIDIASAVAMYAVAHPPKRTYSADGSVSTDGVDTLPTNPADFPGTSDGAHLEVDLDSPASPSSSSIAAYMSGAAFGPPFDIAAHCQRGPSSVEAVAAILELACMMADPVYSRPGSSPILGLQLVSAILCSGGCHLRTYPSLKRLLMRECSRAVLRAMGTFDASPSFISAAFNTATHLVHVLGSDGTAFLTALLQSIFPYYISGYEGVLPRLCSPSDLAAILPEGTTSTASAAVGAAAAAAHAASGVGGHTSDAHAESRGAPVSGLGLNASDTKAVQSGSAASDNLSRGGSRADGVDTAGFDVGDDPLDGMADRVGIDPIVREVGLEALCSLMSTPGILAAMFEVTDCKIGCGDVVTTLLLALGGATNSRYFRRRSKRLRASSGGSLSAAALADQAESEEDEDDDRGVGSRISSEEARHARGAAILCAETIMAVVDSISDRMRVRGDSWGAPLPIASGGNGADTPSADSGPEEVRHEGPQADAQKHASNGIYPTKIDVENLRAMRARKGQLHRTTEAFNDPSFSASSATKALRLLIQFGFIPDAPACMQAGTDQDAQVKGIVKFLRETPGLQKDKIGGILGEPDSLSQAVLSSYTRTFYFADRSFTECLRIFLESFRLPGESQKIDRIVECFAARFFDQNQPLELTAGDAEDVDNENMVVPTIGDEVALAESKANSQTSARSESPRARGSCRGAFLSADAVFTLSFAVVMLNTDQHNPSIRKKMVLEDFVKNMRGVNGTPSAPADFPLWFLSDVFNSIAAVEIRMSDEAGMSGLTDLHWDEQLREMWVRHQALPDVSALSPLDEDIFLICWPSCVASATVVLNEASDAGSAQKALEGLLNVARCGAGFRRSEPTDTVVSVLTMATSVREGPLYGAAVRFGTDIKAQMASVALSGVARQCGDWMRASGWMSLVAYVLRLHALALLPNEVEDAIGGYSVDLTTADGAPLPPSRLTPSWWPSQQVRNEARDNAPGDPSGRPMQKKQPKMNTFFALIAASISGDPVSDEDAEAGEEYPPSYLKLKSDEDVEAEELARKCVSACRIDDVLLNEAKFLRPEALSCLAQALAHAAHELLDCDPTGLSDEAGSRSSTSPVLRAESSRDDVDIDSGLRYQDGRAADDLNRSGRTTFVAESSILTGTARIVRSSGSSVEGDVDLNGYALQSGWSPVVRERDEQKARSSIVAFCIDTLCELTLLNRDRLYIPWPALHGILLRVIDRKTTSMALLERGVVALLRVANRLLHREEVRRDVVRGLNLIVKLPASAAEELSVPVAAGVYNIVKAHGEHIACVSGWHALLSIIENSARFPSIARDISFQSLMLLLTDDTAFQAVTVETFEPLLNAGLAYTSCSSLEVAMQSLDLLCALSKRIPRLVLSAEAGNGARSHVSETVSTDSLIVVDRAWSEYWGPLMRGLAHASRDPRGKVRNTALSALERVISTGGPAGTLSAAQWHVALISVLLPLMNDIFKSNGFLQVTVEAERAAQRKLIQERNASAAAAAPRGRGVRNAVITQEHDAQLMKTVKAACDRTRLRSVTLLSKTFLQHHACIAEGLDAAVFTDIWMGILGAFKAALEGGPRVRGVPGSPSDSEVREHVPESVKNILLVMCASGLLDKSAADNRWEATFKLLNEALPELELEEFVLRASSPLSPSPRSRAPESPEAAKDAADEGGSPPNEASMSMAEHVDDASGGVVGNGPDCQHQDNSLVPPTQIVMTADVV